MNKLPIFTNKGESGTEALPKALQSEGNVALLSQAIHVYRARLHTGVARTLRRGDVNRTTKKWYRQKGTGNARHGARSAPIFVGGGVAHGPNGIAARVRVLPQKMRQKAVKVALNAKIDQSRVGFLAGISKIEKTKDAAVLLKLVPSVRKTIAFSDQNKSKMKLFANIANTDVVLVSELNAYRVYAGGFILLDHDIVDTTADKEVKKINKPAKTRKETTKK